MRIRAELNHSVGGKWFIEKRSMALLIPFLLATSILSALSQISSLGYQIENYVELVTMLTVANLLALLACWVLVEVLNRTLLASKVKIGTALPTVFLVSFAIGATKGFVTGFASYNLGVFETLDAAIGLKWLQTGILGMLLLPSLSMLATGLERTRNKSELLVAERVQQILGRADLGHSRNSTLLSTFKQDALRQIASIESRIASNPGKTEDLGELVREIIDSHLRPLSHSIARERQALAVRVDLEWGIRSVFGGPLLGFLTAYFLIFITLFMGYLQVQPPSVAFSESLLTSAVIGLICTTLWVSRPKNLYVAAFLLISVTGVASFSGVAATQLILPSETQIDFVTLGIVVWLLVLQNIVFFVLLVQMVRRNRSLNIELEALFAEADLDNRAKNAVKEITNRNLAQYLHSDVQNKLLSMSLLFEERADLDPRESISKLREVIEGLDGRSKAASEFSWESLRETVVEHWEGFLDVEFALDPSLPKWLSKPNSLIFEIIMEALSNALRHGNATRVSVEVSTRSVDSSILEIRVADDGFGPKNGKRGLGSDLLEGASKGNWSLHPLQGGGSLLICAIAISKGSVNHLGANQRPTP